MDELQELTRLTVIDIVDNETDGMSSPCSCMQTIPGITREMQEAGLADADSRVATYTQEIVTKLTEEGALDMNSLCHAAHGLSLLLIAEYDQFVNRDCGKSDGNSDSNDGEDESREKVATIQKYLLFDGGPDPGVWKENAKKCNIPLEKVDSIVLSHYHIDHSNGLRSAVDEIMKAKILQSGEEIANGSKMNLNDFQQRKDPSVIVDFHHSQIKKRGFKVRGKIYPMVPDNPSVEEIKSLGGNVKLHKKEHLLNKCFYVSGSIPRKTSFETGLPGHFREIDGKRGKHWVPDEEIPDERYVACKIKGRGIVVFSACSHAGIINVCKAATERLDSSLTAVLGGFHLAGSSVDDRIDATVNALKELDPDILLAGHCTGK